MDVLFNWMNGNDMGEKSPCKAIGISSAICSRKTAALENIGFATMFIID